MTAYRLVTSGVPYTIPGSQTESVVDPKSLLAVAELHRILAARTGRKVADTRIQHQATGGNWVNHDTAGIAG